MSKRRGGFKNYDTYVQEIIRQTDRNGEKGYYPPEEGSRIITRSGPFLVTAIVGISRIKNRIFFRAEGHLNSRRK